MMPHKNISEILCDEHPNIEHYMRLKKKMREPSVH